MRIYKDIYFTTATIHNWIPLLERNDFKDIIIDAFRFSMKEKRAIILAFVIMNNHFHLVWQILPPHNLNWVRQNMLKYTAQQMRNILVEEKNEMLDCFRVIRTDRMYQIWKTRPFTKRILSEKVLLQKINYIHNNVRKKGGNDLEYKYSSALYHATDIPNWDFLGVDFIAEEDLN